MLTLHKNQEVLVPVREFSALVEHFITTIENHISYTVDDTETIKTWNNLVCNGFTDQKFQTVTAVAHMLLIKEPSDMTMGNVITTLFQTLPVLNHYFAITKINEKSIRVKRLVINDMNKLFQDIKHRTTINNAIEKSKQTVQSTLTQFQSEKEKSTIITTNETESKDSSTGPEPAPEHIVNAKDEAEEAEATQGQDDDGFEKPKRTVPHPPSIETKSVLMATNRYSLLGQSNSSSDNQQEEDKHSMENDDDISYDNSSSQASTPKDGLSVVTQNKNKNTQKNKQATDKSNEAFDLTTTCTKLLNILSNSNQDKSQVDILAKWIENDMGPMVNKRVQEYFVHAKKTSQENMRKSTDFYFRDRYKVISEKLKSVGDESQVQVMSCINSQSSAVLDAHRARLDYMMKEIQDLQEANKEYRKQHVRELNMIRQDFEMQCKQYLEDHLQHRKTVFTNQKAAFDIEIKALKSDLDEKMAQFISLKADMQDDLDSLRNEVIQVKAESIAIQQQRRQNTNDDMSSPVREETASSSSFNHVTPNVHNISKSKQHQQDFNSTADDNDYRYTSSNNHPIPVGSTVEVNTGYIFIPQAIVKRHKMMNKELVYDVYTPTERYTFAEKHVTLIKEPNEPKPSPTIPSAPPKQHRYSYHNKRQQYCEDCTSQDDHSTTNDSVSIHQGDDPEVEYIRTTRQLMPNQYRIKKHPKDKTIQTTKMLREAKDWHLTWKDMNEDPKDFYEDLKSRVEEYGILLKSYFQLTRHEDAAFITEDNCHNYKNAHSEMSKSLYNVIYNNQEEWFDKNPKRDLLYHYKKDRNGFGLIKEIVTSSHPNLRPIIKSETMEKPRIIERSTWFEYMNDYRKWIDFEELCNRNYTQIEHVSNILQQIKGIEMFDGVTKKLEDEIMQYEQASGVFPQSLELHRIGLTIYNWLTPDQQGALSFNPSSITPSIHRMNRPVNQVQNPYRPRGQHQQQRNPPSTASNHQQRQRRNQQQSQQDNEYNMMNIVPPGERRWEDVICSACGQAGHDIFINGCDATAMQTKIEDWKRKNRRHFDAKSVLEIFEDYQKSKQSKRRSAKSNRNTLRRRLRAAKMEMGAEAYKEAKELYINAFKMEHKDVDMQDPRENHNLEIKPYDILDSEPESDAEE